MRREVFGLAIAQFCKVCNPLDTQGHSDKRKETFKKSLKRLSEVYANNIDINKVEDKSFRYIQDILKLANSWAISLDSKNPYTLSREMRHMIDNLCSIWIPEHDKFIFSTTDGDFAVMRYYSSWDILYSNIKTLFNVDFAYQLVPLYIPKHLHDDFLFIATLYHEFGHFVVFYNNMYDQPVQKIVEHLNNKTDKADLILNKWFTAIRDLYDSNGVCRDTSSRDEIIESYINEYMADLFGSQYANHHISNHRESNGHGKEDVYSNTHPSYNQRRELVDDFLNDVTDNFLLNCIKEEFVVLGKPLSKRYVSLEKALILSGSPLTINNDEELHSLIYNAWEAYLEETKPQKDKNGVVISSTADIALYERITCSVKTSIKTYFNL